MRRVRVARASPKYALRRAVILAARKLVRAVGPVVVATVAVCLVAVASLAVGLVVVAAELAVEVVAVEGDTGGSRERPSKDTKRPLRLNFIKYLTLGQLNY